MTAVIEELETDWAPFEELKDERPCYDCSVPAVWLERFACCQSAWPKCDAHKKIREAQLARLSMCFSVSWHCVECGARGRCRGPQILDCVTWEPL